MLNWIDELDWAKSYISLIHYVKSKLIFWQNNMVTKDIACTSKYEGKPRSLYTNCQGLGQ